MEGSYINGQKTKIVYGVFTTPENALGGNAICAFQISDVLDTFEGPFKEQETANSNWLPVRDMKVRVIVSSFQVFKHCIGAMSGSWPEAGEMLPRFPEAARIKFEIHPRS